MSIELTTKNTEKSIAGIPDLNPRKQPYVHPSWLAKALAGDRQCLLSLHTQANNFIPKGESDFDLEAYKLNHQAKLTQYAQQLRDEGYVVYTEGSNSFKINAGSAVISGTPDIIAIKAKNVLVVDIKTGKPRASDIAQVKLYMALVPGIGLHRIRSVPEGRLIYRDYDPKEIPSSEITPEFKQQIKQLVDVLKSREVPSPTPSAFECQWCPLHRLCPYRMDIVAEGTADWL